MNKIIISFVLFTCSNAFAGYKCHLEWQTLTDPLVTKDITFSGKASAKITDTLEVEIKRSKLSEIKVTEHYSDKKAKNYLQYNFACNTYLGCNGSRVSSYEGKSEKTKFSIGSNNHIGVGSIEGRELFTFENKAKDDFEFKYITYKDESGKNLGLTVLCSEKN